MRSRQDEIELIAEIERIRHSDEVRVVKRLIDSMLEDVKEKLLTCDQDACLRLQGQAENCTKLLHRLDRTSLKSKQLRET